MIDRIIEGSVKNRVFVLLIAAMAALVGWWALTETPVDAIPDLSDVQVIVYTEYPGQAPQVVEDQVTYPMSTAMLAVPYAKDVRGYSFFGFSMVYVIFEDGTDLYWARSRVLEYLNVVQGRLPAGATPQLGPDATGVGWVYEYTLADFTPRAEVLRAKLDTNGDQTVDDAELPFPDDADDDHLFTEARLRELLTVDKPPTKARSPEAWTEASLKYIVEAFDRDGDKRISREELRRAANFRGVSLDKLRSVQDWYLRYDLMGVDGVAEVASVGGFVRQYQVEVDPEKLRAFGVSLGAVKKAIQDANLDVGGRLIEMAETEYMVRGQGYIRSIEDLETVPIALDASQHAPILLSQVAEIHLGPEVRRGLVDMNGEGEVVTGVVILRFGENAREVIQKVEERLEELKRGLPEGVEVHVSYDRAELIDRAVETLQHKLLEEMLVVALICAIFLLHLRSSLVAIFTLPVGVLLSFVAMNLLGLNANIMSLGGIAIAVGVMVDASVVMVENMHKHRERDPDKDQATLVIEASKEVGPALFFSLLIVTVSFLPVFTLEQQEGRLFGPLAYTKTFAMGFSAVLAVTVIPVLMYYLVRGNIRPEAKNPISRFFIWLYRPVIRGVLRFPLPVIAAGVLLAVATLWPFSKLGNEFMPPLNEGDLLYMPTTPPGISITAARDLLQETDRIIAEHPQVDHVLGKIGRADTATDPAPLTMIETTILLTPEDEWPAGKTIEDIIHELDGMVQIPGVTNAWTMPIKTRIDMLATGIKTPVGIKLLGDDLAELSRVGAEIEGVLQGVEGTASVYSERVVGGNFVDIRVRRADAARYGLNVRQVQEVIMSAIGGMNVTETVEGLERYPVNVRYPRELRDDLEALREVAVQTPMGHSVPLGQVADIAVTKGPPAIKSENARRTAWIFVDLTTSDVGGYVEHAKEVVDQQVQLPEGVSIVWSGQYEYMQRANERLSIVVPITLAIIFILLYAHFRQIGETVMVMVGTIVFAPIGGIWLMYLADFNMSVAAGVGFIALAGLAAETGVVMIVYLDEAYERFRAEGRMASLDDLKQSILEGAVDRVRPKLMTVATTMIGLLPIMYGTETGTRIMKRIAAPMVGGLVSSTLLTLVLIPAIYLLWKGFWLRRELHQGAPLTPTPQETP
ncbi:MAG: CusA/CzcA family heavy metal efflux RND transporter [Alphaproteobacteria bacterium]|nr:CusA/CzcA family heavy metal efflux RND transporter [Alphaproteobacteria bacterium]